MARVLISMKDEFLEMIDDIAKEEHRTRSELIREALRVYMLKNAPTTGAIKRNPSLENLLDQS